MIIRSAKFVTSAVKPDQYPPELQAEIAFAGRSNVGKSSLINTLVNRKHLVKTSSTPGRTRLINFFSINEAFHLVDLPGYGYARVPLHVRRQWQPMVETYLSTRPTLRAVVLILDIRRLPGGDETRLVAWLQRHQIPCVLVATKVDKLSRQRQLKQQRALANRMDTELSQIRLFSARTRQGLASLWEILEGFVG